MEKETESSHQETNVPSAVPNESKVIKFDSIEILRTDNGYEVVLKLRKYRVYRGHSVAEDQVVQLYCFTNANDMLAFVAQVSETVSHA